MSVPEKLAKIEAATQSLGFSMASDRAAGALLRALAASKPGGHLLELGAGTGLSACWLLDGMDARSRLITVDNDESIVRVAREHLGPDPRIGFHCLDGGEFIESCGDERFDLIFADAWPGKFTHLHRCSSLLAVGGIYVVDDLLPQPSWPAGHAPRVGRLIAALGARSDLAMAVLEWSTGIVVAAKIETSREADGERTMRPEQ